MAINSDSGLDAAEEAALVDGFRFAFSTLDELTDQLVEHYDNAASLSPNDDLAKDIFALRDATTLLSRITQDALDGATTFEAFLETRDEPGWVSDLRRKAFAVYEDKLAVPLDPEEWKRVDLRAFQPGKYSIRTAAQPSQVEGTAQFATLLADRAVGEASHTLTELQRVPFRRIAREGYSSDLDPRPRASRPDRAASADTRCEIVEGPFQPGIRHSGPVELPSLPRMTIDGPLA
jgi:hypothetical protein